MCFRFNPQESSSDVDAYSKMGDAVGGITRERIFKIAQLDADAIKYDEQKRQRDMVGALSQGLELRILVFQSLTSGTYCSALEESVEPCILPGDVLKGAGRLAGACNAMAMEYLEDHHDVVT